MFERNKQPIPTQQDSFVSINLICILRCANLHLPIKYVYEYFKDKIIKNHSVMNSHRCQKNAYT